MFNKIIRLLGGDPNRRKVEEYAEITAQINALEPEFESLSSEALLAKTTEFRQRLQEGETLDDLLIEAFAVVREAAKRTIGLRHYDVQMIGGMALHNKTIAEMRTGEGKTLVATLPLYLNGLTGRGTHLITVNDYLARRDARWMAPIYHALGLSVGVLQMAANTENGQKAYVVDLERESPHEEQHQLRLVPRAEAYAADITYGMNSEFGFDYLRDNMTTSLSARVQRGHFFAIIDEVDNILIDEARTPLIISGPAQDNTEWYVRMAQIVRQLRPEDYEINEKDKTALLSELGEARVEELLGMTLRDPERPEDVTPEQARLLGYLEQAMRAQFLFRRNKDYLVQAQKVVIIDEFTGRLMPGRRWSDGLHQAVEAKEGVRVQAENATYATITIQNYFRMYEKLAGMSGTALTEAEEFDKIYSLEVLPIPMNLEYQAEQPESGLVELEGRDENNYKFRYYAHRTDQDKKPVFWRRKDFPDVVFRTEEAKFRKITQEILREHTRGRPVLVGTTSVELSEQVSERLKSEPLQRLCQVLILRYVWMVQHKREEDGRQIPELEFMNPKLLDLPVPEMRKMARDLNISFNPAEENNLVVLCDILDLPSTYSERLAGILKSGVSHQVLNARHHAEEGQIIAAAGEFGAVTLATNMAGRGVDIRLGGEIPEDVHAQVKQLLRRADVQEKIQQQGLPELEKMTLRQRLRALDLVPEDELGVRAEPVAQFRKHIEDEEQVRSLGGLHVIGSERHEARRIDNQLRGRAARQGDPGSSRFYLSMEDELMRMFGGTQADQWMRALKVDEMLPLEVGVVSRFIEQAQTRVEGTNFDVRKHLLEYDDVLNAQRARIYQQRDRIFTKTDLSEDVAEMVRIEVQRRVPEALNDPEGPWKLVAWLDQIQPPLPSEDGLFPPYSLKLVLDQLKSKPGVTSSTELLHRSLLNIAREALEAENEHFVISIRNLLDATEERLDEQITERVETLDTFLEGLELGQEGDGPSTMNARQLADELSTALHFPLKLSNEQQRLLSDVARNNAPARMLREDLQEQVEDLLRQQALTRVIGAIERRLQEQINLDLSELAGMDWAAMSDELLDAVEDLLAKRRERLVGDGAANGGQIGRDLDSALDRLRNTGQGHITDSDLLNLLLFMTQGTKAVFDKKTHRRVMQRTTRIAYAYYAGRLQAILDHEDETDQVLSHLQKAQAIMRRSWGQNVWSRLANVTWDDLDEGMQESLSLSMSSAAINIMKSNPLSSLDEADRLKIIDEVGRRGLTAIFRPLLLGVIGELWVEYLTQMEALRVSIGLEAYAQRDPLVQYKGRAAELFQNLLRDMRQGVITRMFTYRPREIPGTAIGLKGITSVQFVAVEQQPVFENTGEEDGAEGGIDSKETEKVDQSGKSSDKPEESQDDTSNMSRSQKRRRRRR